MKKKIEIHYRNPGHWDIWDSEQRLCRIRGEKGDFCVLRHYSDIENKEGFSTVSDCMVHVLKHFMNEV